MNLNNKLIAEFLGAFLIVFAGCGSAIIDRINGGSIGTLGVAFAFGISVMIMIYSVSHISGAHFNPAVTIAFTITRHFPLKEVLPYILAQISGAVFASFLHSILLNNLAIQKTGSVIKNFAVTNPADSLFVTAISYEIILTFFLMFVIMSMATDYRAVKANAGLAIGFTVFLEALFAGPINGASMNPARSIAPAIFSSDFKFLAAYIIGPILGAILAAITYKYIKCEKDEETEVKGCC